MMELYTGEVVQHATKTIIDAIEDADIKIKDIKIIADSLCHWRLKLGKNIS